MDGNFSKTVLSATETFISLVFTGQLNQTIIGALLILIVITWILAGVKVFLDARQRYDIPVLVQIIVFVCAVITGPLGLLLYTVTKPKYTREEVDFIETEQKFYYQQASRVQECINCGEYLLDNHQFCVHCGEQNRVACSNCATLTDLDDKYCFKCGHKFEEGRKALLIQSVESRKPLDAIATSQTSITDEIKKKFSVISAFGKSLIHNVKPQIHDAISLIPSEEQVVAVSEVIVKTELEHNEIAKPVKTKKRKVKKNKPDTSKE